VALEALVGLVPLLGDLFDAGWKANLRNVALFDEWLSLHRPGGDLPHATRTAQASATGRPTSARANGTYGSENAARGR
jgi:hypothetical protein